MSIKQTYEERILEKILLEAFARGEFPTADELEELYEAYIVSHPDLSIPFAADLNYKTEPGEASSASKYNTFFSTIKEDLTTVYQEVVDRTDDAIDSFDRWRLGLETFKNTLLDLERRADALLLLETDTAGYFSFVEDNFTDFSKIDLTQSNIDINIEQHTVTIGEDLTTKINLNRLLPSEVTFSILNTEGIKSSSDVTGTAVINILKDKDVHWQKIVTCDSSTRQIIGELKVKLNDVSVDVSRIDLKVHASNTHGAVIITGMFSTDGYSFQNLPTAQYIQSVDDVCTFVFPKTSMKYIRLLLTKNGADDVDVNGPIYEFGLDYLRFYATNGYTQEGNWLCSLPLQVFDVDDNIVKFSKVALQTCQTIPEYTGLNYYIRASRTTGSPFAASEWIPIAPFNVPRNQASPTTVVDFAKTLTTEVLDKPILIKTDGDSIAYFQRYEYLKEQMDNIVLIGDGSGGIYQIAAGTSQNIIESNLAVMRNVGPRYGDDDDAYRLRGCFPGWKYAGENNQYIQTVIKVENPEGLIVDLSNSTAFLSGYNDDNKVAITGSYRIKRGTWKFTTLATNVKHIGDIGPFDTELEVATALRTAGIIKGVNDHKQIIEGISYSATFSGTKYYPGVDIYCEAILSRASIFNLIHNTATQYNAFATDLLSDGSRVFIVETDVAIDNNYQDEFFAIIYTTDNEMFDTIELKAELLSQNSVSTPILTAYRLKLGL